jgi:hypothetical protein
VVGSLGWESFVLEAWVQFLAWPVIWFGSEVSSVTVSSARVNPTLNRYLEKPGEGEQEGCAKAKDGWPPNPYCGETEISIPGLDLKGLVASYIL